MIQRKGRLWVFPNIFNKKISKTSYLVYIFSRIVLDGTRFLERMTVIERESDERVNLVIVTKKKCYSI